MEEVKVKLRLQQPEELEAPEQERIPIQKIQEALGKHPIHLAISAPEHMLSL